MLVLVKDAPETIASADVEPGDLVRIGGRCGQRTQRSGVGDALMWPMVVVEVFEFVQGVQDVALAENPVRPGESWRTGCRESWRQVRWTLTQPVITTA
jgi:hypothetical protein